MEQKVRMADIAEKLGISVVSVSKALSDKEGVSEQTRERIKTAAREMGYVPLRKKPLQEAEEVTGSIGILVCDRFFADNTFYASLYRQVSLHCNAQGYSALLEIVSADAERGCVLPAMLQSGKVDGLILLGQIDLAYVGAVTRDGIPYVLLDFYDEERGALSVTSDNVAGGYRLTRHLLQSGRREVAFVGSIRATSSIMDRFMGYTKALLKAGIPLRQDWILEDRGSDGLLMPVILPEPMPQAFVCSCDEVAYDLVLQLKQAGYRVPEDVAVTGYDDYRLALLAKPQLTTYRVDQQQMCRVAVEQLVRAIHGQPVINGNIIINGDLVRRGST